MVGKAISYWWPCDVEVDGRGTYHVRPRELEGCDGVGDTLQQAIEESCTLAERLIALRDDLVIVPGVNLLADDLVSGRVIRIKLDVFKYESETEMEN